MLARIKQLEDQEYDRGRENDQYKNSLSAQIYQFLYQGEQDKIAQEQWQKEFDENVRQWNAQYGSKGSGGGGGGNNYNHDKDDTNNNKNQYTDDTFMNDMSQDRAITGIPVPDLGLFPDRIKSHGGINSVKNKLYMNEVLKNKSNKKTSTNNGGGSRGRFIKARVID